MIRSLHRTAAVGACAALLALGAGAPRLSAQGAIREGSIDPGMSRAQVEERLGPPKVARTSGTTTYLFYANGCLRTCGMDDLVVLEQDAVTDAIFRSPAHRYTGQSSSPAPVEPRASRGGDRGGPVVGEIRSDSVMPQAGRGGLVIGGSAAPDSAEPRRTPQPGRRARTRRTRSVAPGAAAAAGTPTAPPAAAAPAAQPAAANAGAAPTSAPTGAGVNGARTGRRSTTGPVDARAAVKNAGAPLYPAATPVRTPSSGADSSAARVPFQGAQLAPADSDLRALRRATPPPAPPGAVRPDSTRP